VPGERSPQECGEETVRLEVKPVLKPGGVAVVFGDETELEGEDVELIHVTELEPPVRLLRSHLTRHVVLTTRSR
jgi:hypothetical protein